jgi:hypothetical protein
MPKRVEVGTLKLEPATKQRNGGGDGVRLERRTIGVAKNQVALIAIPEMLPVWQLRLSARIADAGNDTVRSFPALHSLKNNP